MNRMDGKVCAVTGGTQRPGAGIARRLAAAGAAGVVVTGRNAERGRAVADSLSFPALFVPADLAEVKDCSRMIAEADRRFGRVDVLVNAAAITDRGTIFDTSPDLFFDAMFATNVRAPFFLMQEAIRLMIRDGLRATLSSRRGLRLG